MMIGCGITWMLWKLGRIDGDPTLRGTRIRATWEYVSSVGEWYLEICRGGQETLGTSGGVLFPKTKLDQSRPNPGIVSLEMRAACFGGPGNRLPGCVIDYTEEHATASGNRLPRLCNRLPKMKSLKIPLLLACSGYETSFEEDPEEDPEELPPEPTVDALDFLEGDEDPLPEMDSPEDIMSASEADSTKDSGPGEMAISGGSSS
ncbi:hypothetical protein HKD37_03G006951 [Glycine soja]